MIDPITAIIVDDEPILLYSLENLINNTVPNVKIIAKAETAVSALAIILEKIPEIIFLDIQMPINDGFWLVKKLQKLQISTCIIFVTAFDKYAIQAIKHSAFDLLTKPVNPDVLKASIDRYVANRNKYNFSQKAELLNNYLYKEKLKFVSKYGYIFILPSKIIYAQTINNENHLYLSNGKIEIIETTLDEIQQSHETFIKINKKTVINSNYFESYNEKTKVAVVSDAIQRFELLISSSGLKSLKIFDLV